MARQSSTTSPPSDLEAARKEAAAGKQVKVRRGRKAVALVPLEDLDDYTASGEAGTPLDQVRRELGPDWTVARRVSQESR